jgi:hypothetical protein
MDLVFQDMKTNFLEVTGRVVVPSNAESLMSPRSVICSTLKVQMSRICKQSESLYQLSSPLVSITSTTQWRMSR